MLAKSELFCVRERRKWRSVAPLEDSGSDADGEAFGDGREAQARLERRGAKAPEPTRPLCADGVVSPLEASATHQPQLQQRKPDVKKQKLSFKEIAARCRKLRLSAPSASASAGAMGSAAPVAAAAPPPPGPKAPKAATKAAPKAPKAPKAKAAPAAAPGKPPLIQPQAINAEKIRELATLFPHIGGEFLPLLNMLPWELKAAGARGKGRKNFRVEAPDKSACVEVQLENKCFRIIKSASAWTYHSNVVSFSRKDPGEAWAEFKAHSGWPHTST